MPLETTPSSSSAMAAVKARLSGFETEAGRRAGLAFAPQPDDVFVVTTPKAGTTMMQTMAHALRTGGDGSFGEISEEGVVPFVELAKDCDIDLDAQQPRPRLYKTHCWQPHCPKGARYIVVVRDPLDVAVSFYSFFNGWFFQPDEGISLDDFVAEFVLARGEPASDMQNASYWHHLTSWWPRRNDADVLFLAYEDIVADKERAVRRVADFILPDSVKSNAEDLQRRVDAAIEMSSLQWMQRHPTKFDEHITKIKRNAACGLPPDAGAGSGKVRAAGATRPTLSDAVVDALHKRWAEVVLPATGCASYAELRASLRGS